MPRKKEILAPYSFAKDLYRLTINSDTGCMTRYRNLTIVSMVNGLRHFSDRYIWTGTGDEGLPIVISSGHTLSGPPREEVNKYKYYTIDFSRILNKGDRTTIETQQIFRDTEKTMKPIFYRIPFSYTDTLILEVEFIGDTPQQFYRETANQAFPELVYEYETVDINRTDNIVRWEISKPRYSIQYGIRWEW